MSDVELVIKMPEEMYKWANDVNKFFDDYGISDFIDLVKSGTPLPKGHGKLKDVDNFLEKVKKDRAHEIYLHSWTADMVLERLGSWYATTIIEADVESEV